MDLEDFVITFVQFANGVILPFLLGLAFLFFLINTIRFFVIGAGNDDSQEKARSLALYSVLAFVFILVFWGIINMLGSSIGLTSDRLTSPTCSDYVCENNPTGSFESGGVDPTPVTIPSETSDFVTPSPSAPAEPWTPSAPPTSPTTPTEPPSMMAPSPPPPPGLPPVAPDTTAGDYTAAIAPVTQTIEDLLPEVEYSFLSDQFNRISSPETPDTSRIRLAKSFADAGLISNSELTTIANNINTIRLEQNETPIPLSSIAPDDTYTQTLATYQVNAADTVDIITSWYGEGITAETTIDRVFNAAEYTLAERQAAANEVLSDINSNDPEVNATLEISISNALNTEAQLLRPAS